MELFYADHIEQDKATFGSDESRHIIKSYRKREGDRISFATGDGFLYEGIIVAISRHALEVEIASKNVQEKVWTGRLHMAVAPTKNFSRIEWMVEKMVELGLDELTPIITDRSERRTWKSDRLARIVKSAAKQSLKCQLPVINKPLPWSEFLQGIGPDCSFYLGHCEEQEKKQL